MAAAAEVTAEVAPVRVLKQKAGYVMESVAKCFMPREGRNIDIRGVDVEMEELSITEVLTKKPKVN